MKFEQKRIFISDLPETANHSEIESIFSAYGKVISINVKQRKELGPKNRSLSFAYVTLETDDRSLHKCFKDFTENDWHGEYVQLQLAKESFLDRLKREREEKSQVESSHGTQILQDNGYDTIEEKKRKISTSNESLVNKFQDSGDCDNSVGKIKKKKKFNVENAENDHCIESLSLDTDSIEVKQKGSKKKEISFDCSLTNSAGTPSSPKKVAEEIDDKGDDFDSDLVIKDNRHKLVGKKKLKIEETGNQPIAVIDLNKKKKNFTKTAEQSLPELRRLQSVKDKVKSYAERKSLIKAALSNVDTKPNNKIKFDEDEDLTLSGNNIDFRADSSNKTKLFESDDEGEDNYEPNFAIKEHFEGKKGKKLLELQAKFKNDKRFILDERFLDDENIDHSDDDIDRKIQNSSINGGYEASYNENESDGLDNEKKKELEILSEILNSENASKLPYNKKGNSALKKIVRYDPNDENCAKMELKKEENVDKKSKKKDSEIYEEKKQEEKEQPVVSKEVFYKVTNKLKEVMQQPKEGFSLLSAFGHVEEKEEKIQEVETPKELPKSKLFTGKSPFKYDSSDDEDETSNIPNKEDLNSEIADKNEPERSNLNNKLGIDHFFFKEDDYRFQDGLDFIKRIATKESTDFIKVRQELKSIMKSKVRNNQRKNKPFKKKLGGNAKKKKQRIKKALQR